MLLCVEDSGKSMVSLAVRILLPPETLYVLGREGPLVFCAENNMKEERGGQREGGREGI